MIFDNLMKLRIILLVLIIFLSGCALTPEKIVNNPAKVVEKCDKFEDLSERNNCLSGYAKSISLISGKTGVGLCTNLEPGFPRNKCIFDIFVELEKADKIDEAISVCKDIDKEGFSEWCESRRSRDSIAVAPSLD